MMAVENGSFFNLAGPPRSVPLLVKLGVILGGMYTQSGFFLVGFGMIFVWAITMKSDLMDWYRFRDPLDIATGTILYSKKTGWSDESRFSVNGNSEHRKDTPIYAIYYSFVGPDGIEYTSVSYKRGMALQKDLKVKVEYPQGKPEISRIIGMRAHPLGPAALFLVILPILGISTIIHGLRKGIIAQRLLKIGWQTTGRLQSKTIIAGKLGMKHSIYKLTFEFTNEDGIIYEAICRTRLPEKLEDEAEEPLLYDPVRPSNAVMLDALPGSPRIDENGNIKAGSLSKTLLCFVLPVLTVMGNVGYIFIRFLAD